MPCNLRVLSCVQTAGASIFAVLLSRNDPLTCIRLSCAVSLCALPLLVQCLWLLIFSVSSYLQAQSVLISVLHSTVSEIPDFFYSYF